MADSATPVHSAACKTEPIDTGRLIQSLVRQYQYQKCPVSVNFRSVLPALNSTDRFTHLIHPYPAKLLVHIPYLFLTNDLLSRPGDIVLDPFCGSGTVLLEAQLANRRAYGADANPLARLIARVKTTPLDAGTLKRTLDDILSRLALDPSGPPPDVVNLDHWFYPSAVKQLQCLREAIERVSASEIRDFLLVCFSACVRKVSLADPRLSVPVRLRFGQYPLTHPLREKSDAHLRHLQHVQVTKVFGRVTQANIARMETMQGSQNKAPRADVLCSDARRLIHEYSLNGKRRRSLAGESVQLIITSPPYPGAQKYIRACSLSLGWLGLCAVADLHEYKGRMIGREEFVKAEFNRALPTNIPEADKVLADIRRRNPIRAAIGATYLNEMRVVIREMYRVLKPGGHLILVVANNHASGREFRTADYLRTVAEECGLSLTACFIDAIRSRGLMTKRNHTASVITREWVLILTKGAVPNWSR
jgi:DNA modification methylase